MAVELEIIRLERGRKVDVPTGEIYENLRKGVYQSQKPVPS